MAFVDGDEADVHPPQFGAEDVGVQPLGRDVEEFVLAEDGVLQRGDHLLAVHARVDAEGADAAGAEVLHLVFHQGDEGGDHQAHAFAGQRGHLEGDGLAAARGHEAQRVAPAPDAADDVFLDAAERVVAPILFQQPPVEVVRGLFRGGRRGALKKTAVFFWKHRGLFRKTPRSFFRNTAVFFRPLLRALLVSPCSVAHRPSS